MIKTKTESHRAKPQVETSDALWVSSPSLPHFHEAIEDARMAVLDGDPGPPDPTIFHELRGRLEAARMKLPPLYREKFHEPYVSALDGMGPYGFNEVLRRDPHRTGLAGLMLDLAHCVLQNGEGYHQRPTDAFQEVVSDLYDGYLSDADRRGIEPPDEGVIPPLVKWGNPNFGPYTWPATATKNFGVGSAAVSLPPANARRGLLAWAALGHETAGHDVLHADHGLRRDLAGAVFNRLVDNNFSFDIALYWARRIDETASDVLGILNMGPAAAIGLIGYFRGIRAAYTGIPTLRNAGGDDVHPVDIVRGYLGAETVRLLSFDGAKAWADVLAAETDKDVSQIRLAGKPVTQKEAHASAQMVAEALIKTKVAALEQHALGEIQDWRNADEKIVDHLRKKLTTPAPPADCMEQGIYAAHAVAAAVTATICDGLPIGAAFGRMIDLLKTMHDTNPSWGPHYVAHPGSLTAHMAYVGG